jgi:hypothetical protein
MGGKRNQAQQATKQKYEQIRLRERIVSFVEGVLKDPKEIVSPQETVLYIKEKYNEYSRRNNVELKQQVLKMFHIMFSEKSGLANI